MVMNRTVACSAGVPIITSRCSAVANGSVPGTIRCIPSNPGRLTPAEIQAIMLVLAAASSEAEIAAILSAISANNAGWVGPCQACQQRELHDGAVRCLPCNAVARQNVFQGRPVVICPNNDAKCMNAVACDSSFKSGSCFGAFGVGCDRKCNNRSKKGLLGLLGLLGIIPLALCCLLFLCCLLPLCLRKRKPKAATFVPAMFPATVMPAVTCAPVADYATEYCAPVVADCGAGFAPTFGGAAPYGYPVV